MTSPVAPSRPALRYHGGKWLLAPWILKYMPPHEVYCEPYAGSAAVLLRKERSVIEIYNDMDEEVVNFFRVLRDQPEELISKFEMTPFAKVEWQNSFKHSNDPVENARRFLVRASMSIAGPTAQWNTGWRRQKQVSRRENGNSRMSSAAMAMMRTSHLWTIAQRLRGVTIECDAALDVLHRYDSPDTCFYVDPPYMPETRDSFDRDFYAFEMDEEDHIDLAGTLRGLEASVMISGYRCPLYDQLFEGWRRYNRFSRINGTESAVESLWLNPHASKRMKFNHLPLFAGKGVS